MPSPHPSTGSGSASAQRTSAAACECEAHDRQLRYQLLRQKPLTSSTPPKGSACALLDGCKLPRARKNNIRDLFAVTCRSDQIDPSQHFRIAIIIDGDGV